MIAAKLIEVAKGEVGYLEKASNKNLDSKTANAGSGNYTKYWRDLDPSMQGQSWCDAFVGWCFVQAYGLKEAERLQCDGTKVYYTPSSANLYKIAGRWSSTPVKGAQIFFKNTERICHTGIVIDFTETTVTTIEGNTSGGSAVVANGGGVFQKTYQRNNTRIAGYGCPDFSGESEGYMFSVSNVKNGSRGNSVLLLQEILKARGFKGADKKALELDGQSGGNTVYAINAYQSARRKQGVELGSNGKNDGECGPKMWADLLAL